MPKKKFSEINTNKESKLDPIKHFEKVENFKKLFAPEDIFSAVFTQPENLSKLEGRGKATKSLNELINDGSIFSYNHPSEKEKKEYLNREPEIYVNAFENRCNATGLIKEGIDLLNDKNANFSAYGFLKDISLDEIDSTPNKIKQFINFTNKLYIPLEFKSTELIPQKKEEYERARNRYDYYMKLIGRPDVFLSFNQVRNIEAIEELKAELNLKEQLTDHSPYDFIKGLKPNYYDYVHNVKKEYPIGELLLINFYIQGIVNDKKYNNFNNLHPLDKQRRESLRRIFSDQKIQSLFISITNYLSNLTDKIISNEEYEDLDPIIIKLLVPYALFFEDENFLEFLCNKFQNTKYFEIMDKYSHEFLELVNAYVYKGKHNKISLWLERVNKFNEENADMVEVEKIEVNPQNSIIKKDYRSRVERKLSYVPNKQLKKTKEIENKLLENEKQESNKVIENFYQKNYLNVLDKSIEILKSKGEQIPQSFLSGYMKKIIRSGKDNHVWRLRPGRNNDGRIFVYLGENFEVLDAFYINTEHAHKQKIINNLL